MRRSIPRFMTTTFQPTFPGSLPNFASGGAVISCHGPVSRTASDSDTADDTIISRTKQGVANQGSCGQNGASVWL